MTAIPNSHLVLHKETLKQRFKNKTSVKHLIKIINLGAINCPVVRNGLNKKRLCLPGVGGALQAQDSQDRARPGHHQRHTHGCRRRHVQRVHVERRAVRLEQRRKLAVPKRVEDCGTGPQVFPLVWFFNRPGIVDFNFKSRADFQSVFFLREKPPTSGPVCAEVRLCTGPHPQQARREKDLQVALRGQPTTAPGPWTERDTSRRRTALIATRHCFLATQHNTTLVQCIVFLAASRKRRRLVAFLCLDMLNCICNWRVYLWNVYCPPHMWHRYSILDLGILITIYYIIYVFILM